MRLTFRIDDVTPTMDWDRFYKTIEMLHKFNVKPILGVIPSCKDEKLLKYPENPNFWREMKDFQNSGHMIALHGYEHLYVTDKAGIFPVNEYSEFSGLPYKEQYTKIRNGKQILEEHGLFTDIFMAPAHSFDENTCKALLENGIYYATDGFGKTCYKRHGIKFLPIALTWRRALHLNHWENCTIVVHTNSVSTSLLKKYEQICNKYQDKLFSWNQTSLTKTTFRNYIEMQQRKEFIIYRIWDEISRLKSIVIKHRDNG